MIEINPQLAMVQQLLNKWVKIEKGNIVVQDALRVQVNDDGTINLLDFTMPSMKGRERRNIPQVDVPKWVMESISMLRITEEGSFVADLGFKVTDSLYYISNKEGE